MTRFIYDILPPKYKEPARKFMVSTVEPFWRRNSGKIKLGMILVAFLI